MDRYRITGILRGAKFSRVIFSRKRFSFIHIHQARSKLAIVCTRDARSGDHCQVVQYMVTDALHGVSGMRASYASGASPRSLDL